MKKAFRKPYSEDWCYALYTCYESGDDSVLSDLLVELCPLIRWAYLSEVERKLPDQPTIEANALLRVYDTVTAKGIPNNHPRVFTKFLRTIIIRSIRDSFRELKSQEFDFNKVCFYPAVSPFVSHNDVELGIYKDQIRDCIRSEVLSKLRFIGEERSACKLILDSLLGYKNFDPKIAKRKYKVNSQRCKYLIRYLQIMIKAASYDQREQECRSGTFTPVWSSSGSFLCALS